MRGWPRMSPARLKLTITVMSIGLARASGGGFQQLESLANTSLMVLTGLSAARPAAASKASGSAATIRIRSLPPAPFIATGSFHISRDLYLQHLVGIGHGAAGGARRRLLQIIDDIHALHDLTDNGILAIEARRVSVHDEELRIGGIDAIAAARHADDAALEVDVGKFLLQVRIFR